MSVVLVSPPMVKACEPLLGIATLQAYLRSKGVPCTSIDANAEGQEWLLQADRIDAQVQAIEGAEVNPRLGRLLKTWPSMRRRVDRFKRALRSPEGYTDLARYRTHVTSLGRVMGLAGALHDHGDGSPIVATLSNYEDGRYCDMSSASVLAAAHRPEHNLFHDYFRDVLIPQIAAHNPQVVGISFIFRSQLLPGAVLAAMIQRAMPHVHVTLGGELVSAWAPILSETRLLDLADSILPYEGELGLLALARAVAHDEAFDEVPNLCWVDGAGTLHTNPTAKLSSLESLPTPEYDWAPWELYFAPERTAPLVTARGCYWNRCTFCPEVINPESKLRLAGVRRVTEDMDTLHERHGVTCFHFIDSALPPRTLIGVAEHVIAGSRPYRWYGFSRLETTLLRDGVAERLGRGGCAMLKLGLESGSQRLLDQMDKQQDVGTVSDILRALRRSGVMVHAFLMFGSPREVREDAVATEAFVAEHAHCIQFMNCSLMNLAHGSPMAEAPAAHGIRQVTPFEIPGHTLDLALYSNFEGEGWGRLQARRFLHDRFLRHGAIRPIHLQTPALFDSNHSVFFRQALSIEAEAPRRQTFERLNAAP